ncbi:hypothetical protein LZ30DRAFT_87356 [Colletotrichum cereale]|nr:hypothetical protein LZ30DRAFT_87356 [Colletotrichum cereale]
MVSVVRLGHPSPHSIASHRIGQARAARAALRLLVRRWISGPASSIFPHPPPLRCSKSLPKASLSLFLGSFDRVVSMKRHWLWGIKTCIPSVRGTWRGRRGHGRRIRGCEWLSRYLYPANRVMAHGHFAPGIALVVGGRSTPSCVRGVGVCSWRLDPGRRGTNDGKDKRKT